MAGKAQRRVAPPDGETAATALIDARTLLANGRWEQARSSFERALEEGETPEVLEGLAAAAWWLEDVPTVLASRERAYALFRERDDVLGAGRMATELGLDYAVFRAEMAVSSGWFQRAHRLLDHAEPAVEQVWLTFREAELAYHMAGDMEVARRLAVEVQELAVGLGLLDLEMVGQALEGLSAVGLGQVAEGMVRLDDATTAAVAGDMHDLKAVAATCCFMVFACERVRDVDRASQWCDQFMEFYRRNDMAPYLGFCRAHHASVLIARGRWEEAEDQLGESRRELRARAAWSLTIFERLGELRLRQGRLQEAQDSFERAVPHPGGVLGTARVAFDRGELDVALDIAEGMLRRLPERDRVERVATLELLVRLRCADGDLEGAGRVLAELEAAAEDVGTDWLTALAAHGRGQVALAAGDPESANRHLQDALDRYERARLPFEASLVGLDRARALYALGRGPAAVEQARRACAVLRTLGAAGELARGEVLLHELSGSAGRVHDQSVLTPREVEVLELLARGLTNQQIAGELVVSRHTVRRHLSNIFVKLDVASRTAAVAHALENRLV